MKEVEHGATDRKDVAGAIGLDPRDWKKTQNGRDVLVLPIEFETGRADEECQYSPQDNRTRTNKGVGRVIHDEKITLKHEKWGAKKNEPGGTKKGENG